jgi:hypothetical protein
MTPQTLSADYLIVGAGAMGMAFVDELLTQRPDDRVILVDKHAKPGGHWNDAYPFVSLHQPAAYYGVNSEKLGTGGAYLASGVEVLSYFERVLTKWVSTGRLQYFPMCEYRGDGVFVSTVAPDLEYEVAVGKKTVDATYMKVEVPSVRAPSYPVAEDISLVPPNALPSIREPRSEYVVIGAGKTGMDAVLFLLNSGVDPDLIRWIMPNDAWLLDRAQIQPGRMTVDGPSAQLENFASSNTLGELYRSLEADERILRLDKEVWPTKYRCATVSLEELDQLRSIREVVRLGRVERIDSDSIVLEHGKLPTDASVLHIDCTADGLAKRPVRPVFEGRDITLQSLFICQQVFSAAVIAYVETRFDDDKLKNEMCQAVPHPELPRDIVAGMSVSLANIDNWTRKFGIWLRGSRLFMAHHESLIKLLWFGFKTRKLLPEAVEKMSGILEKEFPTPSAE